MKFLYIFLVSITCAIFPGDLCVVTIFVNCVSNKVPHYVILSIPVYFVPPVIVHFVTSWQLPFNLFSSQKVRYHVSQSHKWVCKNYIYTNLTANSIRIDFVLNSDQHGAWFVFGRS